MEYLLSFYNGKSLSASFAKPDAGGRLFYETDFAKLNFEARRVSMSEVLDFIRAHLTEEAPPTFYIGSTPVDSCLPGIRAQNDFDFRRHRLDVPPTIWIGNRTIASCHSGAPNKGFYFSGQTLAASVAGDCAPRRAKICRCPSDESIAYIGCRYPRPLSSVTTSASSARNLGSSIE